MQGKLQPDARIRPGEGFLTPGRFLPELKQLQAKIA